MNETQWNDMPAQDRRQLLEIMGESVAPSPRANARLDWHELPAELRQVLQEGLESPPGDPPATTSTTTSSTQASAGDGVEDLDDDQVDDDQADEDVGA